MYANCNKTRWGLQNVWISFHINIHICIAIWTQTIRQYEMPNVLPTACFATPKSTTCRTFLIRHGACNPKSLSARNRNNGWTILPHMPQWATQPVMALNTWSFHGASVLSSNATLDLICLLSPGKFHLHNGNWKTNGRATLRNSQTIMHRHGAPTQRSDPNLQ